MSTVSVLNRPRFFCEHCHAEVRSTDKICPHCSRFFGLVRCPQCSYTGNAERFTVGCPSCGYAGGRMDGDGAHSHLEILPLEDVDPDGFAAGRRPARAWFLDLPLWFFLGSAFLLLAVIIRTLVWLLS